MRARAVVVRTLVGSVALVAAVLGSTIPAATAAPAGNIVVFGDSFASNPAFFSNVGDGCHLNPESWPSRLDARTPKRVDDFACANSSLFGGYNIYDQARYARRVIDKNTKAILIQLGFNDFGGGLDFLMSCYTRGCAGGDERFPTMTSDAYANRLRAIIDYVRYYSPKAKVAIVGYPELYAADQRDICTKLPGGVAVTRPGTSAHPAFMRKLERVQAAAARKLNVQFVSLAQATQGHGTCAADSWVSGFFHPFDGTATRLQGHPTATGDRVAARTIAHRVGL